MPKHDWRQYFPYDTPRQEQIVAIDSILDAYESGKRFYVFEAGTGVGKSAIGVTVAKYCKNHLPPEQEGQNPGASFLTTQKLLQTQYSNDFKEIISLMSSSNYKCTFHKLQSCKDSRKLLESESKGTPFFRNCSFNCIYKKTKKDFIEGDLGVTNFAYFLTESNYNGAITPKNLLVIDEAHNVPSELSRFIEVTFSDRFSKSFVGIELPKKITPVAFVKWVKSEYIPKLREKVDHFESTMKRMGRLSERVKSGEFKKLSRQFELLTGHLKKVEGFNDCYSKENWVMNTIPPKDKSGRKVEFKPIDVAQYAQQYLLRMGQRVLFMSATFVDTDKFATLCGIDKDLMSSMTIPSPFPLENRPIIYSGVGKLTANEIEASLPRLTNAVKAIIKEHKNEKGIIHCHSYKIAWHLKRSIRNKRLLIHDSTNRDEVLREHMLSQEPTVLLSPSMTEGVDLKEDLSRFQIICKVPYPYLGDPLVRKKMNRWNWWYNLMTAATVIQSVGRSVRSESDQAVTYILDSSWYTFFSKNRHLFGPEFQKAI